MRIHPSDARTSCRGSPVAVSGAEIAGITAGAVVLGALVGGGTQMLVVSRQHAHDRDERRPTQKRDVYREYLHLVSRIPDLTARFETVGRSGGFRALRTEFTEDYDRLRADLALFGTPEIRQKAEPVWEACRSALDEYDRRGSEVVTRTGEQFNPELIRVLFERHVDQAFEVLGRAVAQDTDSA